MARPGRAQKATGARDKGQLDHLKNQLVSGAKDRGGLGKPEGVCVGNKDPPHYRKALAGDPRTRKGQES